MSIKNTSPISRALLLISIFAILLVILRVEISQKLNFVFLIRNLALAWIPYMISTLIKDNINKFKFSLIFIPLLLFFPNTIYIITDLIHIADRLPVPIWYDSLLLFLFAWIGTMLSIFPLLRIERYMCNKFNRMYGFLTIFIISFLTAFGIYLGRFERWNSWDILLNPIDLLKNSLEVWTSTSHLDLPLFTSIFTVTILSIYYVVKVILEANTFKNTSKN